MAPITQGRARWLIVSQYYPPEIGAPQIRLSAVVRHLRERGLAVEVLTALPNYPTGSVFPGYGGCFRKVETIDHVAVHHVWLYAASGRRARYRLANYLSFTCTAVVYALFMKRPDVVFIEGQPLTLGFVGVALMGLRGVPYIFNIPDLQMDVAEQMGFVRSRTILSWARRVETFFLKHALAVSTVTTSFRDHFIARGLHPERVTLLPNGADTRHLRPLAPDEELSRRFGIEGKKVFTYMGTHAYYHGLDVLVEAARLLDGRKDIVFLLIGNGPERQRLIDLAREGALTNVVFEQCSYEEMPRCYSVTSWAIATLRDMPVANGMRLSKIFPPLSCGVPVIYSGTGEAAELLRAHDCGVVTAPGDAHALAAAVARVADDAALRDRLGRRGRALVQAEFSWPLIVDRWLSEVDRAAMGEEPVRD